MIDSVRAVIHESLHVCATMDRHHWVTNIPGQAVLCAAQVIWTADITKAICEGIPALKSYYQELAVSECTKRTLIAFQ